VQVSQALNSRRIARSLVTVFLLTLIQSVAPPILAPKIMTPQSQAVTGTFTASSSTSRSYITIPAGVESITLTITGGGGGKGGTDGNKVGGNGGMAQRVVASFAVTPGDVVALFPGNAGSNGTSGASINSGGTGVGGAVAGGASTTTDTYWNVNGTSYQNPSFSGGGGGKVGAVGGSGSGGGGGAASVVAINRNIVAIAGGAGGGGGAGNATGAQGTDGVDANTPNSNLMYGGVGKDSGAGLNCSASDGGGGGGGGGGYYAGTGGSTELVGNECSGRGGFRGNSYIYDALSSTVSSFNTSATPASPLNGSITYSYDVKSPSTCTPTSTTVDIYTVLKFDASINCTWTVPSTVSVVDIFAVGGGGGGGHDGGTGGGGGAGLSRTAIAVTPSSNITIRVGYGGRGGNFNAWNSEYGETSTVTTSTGAAYHAPGGQGGGARTGGQGAGGSAAVNGTFAGGAGGIYPSFGAVGGAGNFGISNYFFGSQNTYAGGGGGGCYFDYGSNVSGAIGRNGGGAGCSNTSASGQVNGIAGTAGTGGGGGGGGAGPAGRVMAGKGGSGVVLIRYATDSANSFPASLSSALAARWSPGDLQLLDSTRKGWIDSSGTNASLTNDAFISGAPTITTQGTTDAFNPTGSSKTLLTASGGTGDKITLKDLPTGYSLFHVARYVRGGITSRIIASTSGNWLSGFWSGSDGVAHHNSWLTTSSRATQYKWILSSDRNTVYRADGRDVSNDAQGVGAQSTSTGFGINNWYAENSNWQVADVIVFNRELSPYENRLMEIYIARIYGLTLAEDSTSSETDTAATFNGNYYYTQYNYGNNLNDTFTVMGWIKPTTACATNECGFFGRELSLVMRAYLGRIWFALRGNNEWEWTDTGINVGYNEWHHFAITKRLVGNNSASMDYYLDGQFIGTKPGNPYRAGSSPATTISNSATVNQENTWTYLGIRYVDGNSYWPFYGALDEFKVWKVARTAAQIAEDMHSSDPSSPQLQMYYDFNKSIASSSSIHIPNLGGGGPLRADLIPAGTANYTDLKLVTQSGPYTTITFPRSYITQNGGWKVPASVTNATTIVVGGGGGAGKSSSDSSSPGGAGGGGGVSFVGRQIYVPGTNVSIKVGVGGVSATAIANDATTRNGYASLIVIPSQTSIAALGGGGGGSFGYVGAGSGAGDTSIATGGGGGGIAGLCADNGASGGTVSSGYNGGLGTWGWGGAGGGARGAAVPGTCGNGSQGSPGAGYVDLITNSEYGRGGYNNSYSTWSTISGTATANNGWGGSVAYNGSSTSGVGRQGSAGVVVVRYLSAAKPSFTYPTNAYLNVGMTETFTTNVAQDSATAMLTRTFKWESTTAGAGGTYTTIKQGTGAANAAYSWIPSDTSTTGNQYLYRVVVTDSDTAGLFYTDTSTPVFAVINGALRMTGNTTVSKTINIARNETFTISSGTPTYRYTLSPLIPGVTLDTTTAGTTILKISDTVTVGTYSETLTVTDSVSASVSIPLMIKVTAPPSLTAGGEIVKNGQVINLDAGNSSSILLADGTVATSRVWSDISGSKLHATTTSALYNSLTCNAPTYSTDNGGILTFSAAAQTCYQTPFLGTHFTKSYTIESWVKLSSAMTSGMQIISQAYSVQYDNIAMAIGGLDQGQAGKIFVGFFDGSTWRLAPNGYTPTLNTWFHILATYDGANMYTYINGSLFSTVAYTGGATTQNTKGFYIGKRWDASSSDYFFSGSIGEMRAYNRALSPTEVSQNFNATKFRYTAVYAQNIVKPSQKYGALNLESFTVTSGGDTKTVTFAVGDRAGIDWDSTTTPGVVKLSVQESLTPGTYYDTITVTDNFAVSTILPIKFTVTKADTLTVYVETPTALSYTGSRASFTPSVKTVGAVSFESGTVLSAPLNFKPGGTTCATGGYCRVGDIGPGGGIVFIDTSTASSDGRIYEAAPQNWTGSDDLASIAQFCTGGAAATSNISNGSQVGIGWGDTLTANFDSGCTGGAAQVAADLTLNGYSDWFVPSENEAVRLYINRVAVGLIQVGSNWTTGNWGYWTSTENSSSAMRVISNTSGWSIGNVAKNEATKVMLRPVRAFRSCWAIDTCTALATSDTPTAAGVYVITPTTVSNSADLLTKYTAITYATSRLTINRIAQRAQVIPFINTNYPETFTVSVTEGNGNGAISYSAVNGTASGCAFDYKKLYTTSQGTCTVTVVKAGDRNYLPDTVTANVLFLAFVINQPSPTAGSGPTIALSGATSITLDPNVAPSITSLSTYTATAGSTQLIINGAGFNQADIASITVKFWRNVVASGFTIDAGNSQITVTVPAGATSGKVTVTTPNGMAVSELPLTITP
jgi:hypothetical protein